MARIATARKPLEYRFDQVSFGRHQTFHLRYAWLTKGFQAMSVDPRAFDADQSTVTLGVGKNIVHQLYSLRDAIEGPRYAQIHRLY